MSTLSLSVATCYLLITFANSLDPDHDLTYCWSWSGTKQFETLKGLSSWINYFEKVNFEEKVSMKNYPTCEELSFSPSSATEKKLLKLSSAAIINNAYVKDYFGIKTNLVDPDQTAPLGAVWSWFTLFATEMF